MVQFRPDYSNYSQNTYTDSKGNFTLAVEPNTGGSLLFVGDIEPYYDLRIDIGDGMQYVVEDIVNSRIILNTTADLMSRMITMGGRII